MIAFRHCDPRFPFLHETADQPPGRWHGAGEGPVNYLADTPDGAWAEFLRHEEISDPRDLEGVRRTLWAVEIGQAPEAAPDLPSSTLMGGLDSYGACRDEARRLRASRMSGLVAPSAALNPGHAHGWTVRAGQHPGEARDGRVIVLFGPRPDLVGWRTGGPGRPDARVLAQVIHFQR